MTDKLFLNHDESLNEDQKYSLGFFSPYQQQQITQFNKSNNLKSPLSFMQSPLKNYDNELSSCFENNPLNRMFEFQHNSLLEQLKPQLHFPREFQTPQQKIFQDDLPGRKIFMSEKIKMKMETPIKEEYLDSDLPSRSEKGLKNLSIKVREIVGDLKSTTYKQVAEKLIILFWEQNKISQSKQKIKDEQNIKRRVYDALNVMIASGVLRKEGKLVKVDEELAQRLNNQMTIYQNQYRDQTQKLVKYQKRLQAKIQSKKNRLDELMSKYLALNNLIDRNQDYEEQDEIKMLFPIIYFQTNPVEITFRLEKKVLMLSSKKVINLNSDIDALIQLDLHHLNNSKYFQLFPKELRNLTNGGELSRWADQTQKLNEFQF